MSISDVLGINPTLGQPPPPGNAFTWLAELFKGGPTVNEVIINRLSPEADKIKSAGLLPSIVTAQAILEGRNKSGTGFSSNFLKGNNLFNVKGTGPAGSMSVSSPEYNSTTGQWSDQVSNFKKYNSWDESLTDYMNNFHSNTSYATFLQADDYKAAAQALQGVYATDPKYAEKLTGIIQQYDLTALDKGTPRNKDAIGNIVGATTTAHDTINSVADWLNNKLPQLLWIVLGVAIALLGAKYLFGEESEE